MVEASVALPLDAARRLSSSDKDELEIVFRNLYLPKDMQRLAAKWEPSRTLDAEFKESLREDLIDLLRDRRPQYAGYTSVTLPEAQADPNYGNYIARSVPTKDAKKLLKVWARNLTPMPTTRKQIIDHLLQLLPQHRGIKASRLKHQTRTPQRMRPSREGLPTLGWLQPQAFAD